MENRLTVIIPAYNAAAHLTSCLQALKGSMEAPFETIVVDDGSDDDTVTIAHSFAVTVLHTERRQGPSIARNLGARAASGELLFFLDADVCVHPQTISRVIRSFEADPELDAIMGSYDYDPWCPDFISQYRNLMHAYTHHRGAERACTFWSGCGAIRRAVFLEHSGFDEGYGRPAIEDIELGYRLLRAGRKLVLDRTILVTHLKRWTFWGLVKTDIFDRGIPWTELILRDRFMPNDLNLELSQRVSVALVFILVALSGTVAVMSGGYFLVPLFAILFLMLARWWGQAGSHRRPKRAVAMLTCVVVVLVVSAYASKMFGLIPPLIVTPVLLLLKHRYHRDVRLPKTHRILGIAFICASVCVAALYLPAHHLIFGCFAVLVLLGLMNSQFYIFLAGNRGVAFMLAAIPFHLLYHFYNGLSFIAGASLYARSSALSGEPRPSIRPRRNLL